jgi:L-lactate dehydrogenase complex protein LldG
MSIANNRAARDAILKRVQAAILQDPSKKDRAEAKRNAENYLALNARGPQPKMALDVVQRFIDWSIKMGSTIDRVATLEGVPMAVAGYCQSQGIALQVSAWPMFAALDWRGAGVACEVRPATGFDKCCVTGVTAGIAETGTILITPSKDEHTASVLLPDDHIAVIPAAQIVGTMEDAMARVKSERGELPRAMNFISGPSRTADIEQTLVIGAHGPIRVHVIVVG